MAANFSRASVSAAAFAESISAAFAVIADAVHFLPPQSRESLVRLYRAADLVAVPSYSESFGLVAVEAQACGTPVVAASVGGLPVAVDDGSTGVLIDGHDPTAQARWLEKLRKLGWSPQMTSNQAVDLAVEEIVSEVLRG